MANYYYEITQTTRYISPGIYVSKGSDRIIEGVITTLAYPSERIWMEDEDGVQFIKARTYAMPKVDLEEFMWIKLRAKRYRKDNGFNK